MDSIRDFIARNDWTFAKTYAAFCPHEYVVMYHIPYRDRGLFVPIAVYIRDHGFLAKYGKMAPKPYLVVDDYYYWTCDDPIEKTDLINRARMSDYIFEESLTDLVVRRRKKGEAVQTDYSMLSKYLTNPEG